MRLPADCPFAGMTDSQFIETKINRTDCCRTLGPYWASGPHELLCRSRPKEDEAYRLFWQSSFDGDAVVHVARKGESIAVRWTLSFLASEGTATVSRSLDDWEKLQRALVAANFWSLTTRGEEAGFDGAQWLIEGRCGDVYHAIHRWSPGGAVHDLGRLFFALAGPPLAGIELY